ncbi:hypothetical protein M231_05235 [Tremella mesenterica]|uniref:F-box domain-containing protein n=1 Tax=Tremella mesenterica TaxID=5217 RepID=A0A4Q1BIN5_TREME|nr:hypothetical protein M231_05235 [Tremella mesenterica]
MSTPTSESRSTLGPQSRLFAPDLLRRILSFLPRHSLTTCLLVSRGFFAVASDVLYHTIDVDIDYPPHALTDLISPQVDDPLNPLLSTAQETPPISEAENLEFKRLTLVQKSQAVILRYHTSLCSHIPIHLILSPQRPLHLLRVHSSWAPGRIFHHCFSSLSDHISTPQQCHLLSNLPSLNIHTLVLRGLENPSVPPTGIDYSRLPPSLRRLILVLETGSVVDIPKDPILTMRHLRPTIREIVIVFHSSPRHPWRPARVDRSILPCLSFGRYLGYLASLVSVPMRTVTFVGMGRIHNSWTGMDGGEEEKQEMVKERMEGMMGTVGRKGGRWVGDAKFKRLGEWVREEGEGVFDDDERKVWEGCVE